MSTIYKPIILENDGVFGQLPDGEIINAGGTSNSTWTVNGRGLLFDDGTSTSPGGTGSSPFDLQAAYNNSINLSGEAKIKLATGKDFLIADDTDDSLYFRIDSETGKVTITGDLEVLGSSTIIETVVQDADHWMISPNAPTTTPLKIEPDFGVTPIVDLVSIRRTFGSTPVFRIDAAGNVIQTQNLIVGGLINGIDLDQFHEDFLSHLAGDAGFRHQANAIDVAPIAGMSATNVQQALEELKSSIGGGGGGAVNGYEHIEFSPSSAWYVIHSANTYRVQVTIYDDDWEMIIPNSVKVVDSNTVLISFSSPVSGRAMVLMF